jgi:thymidine phosphorylase
MLVSGGLAPHSDEAAALALRALEDGSAAEHFNRMVAELGGPADFLADVDKHLGKAPVISECVADRQGYVTGYDTRGIGLCVVTLGGGRTRPSDPVDHAVGLTGLLPIGTWVEKDTPIAFVHARDDDQVAVVRAQLRESVRIGEEAPAASPVILGRQG